MRAVTGCLLALATVAAAQGPSIELRRIRTMVDQDGRAFVGAPREITALGNGMFVLDDDGPNATRPIVMDSTGRFVKYLAPRGSGPGEIPSFAGPFRVGRGDTLFVVNNRSMMLFDPSLKFVRAEPLGIGVGDFQIVSGGYILNSNRKDPAGKRVPFHEVSRTGQIVRSMGVDTFPERELHVFRIAPSQGGFWANQYPTHRFERWTLGGERRVVIETKPSWFYPMSPGRLAPFSTVRSIREVDGRLWVISWVPSPRIAEIMAEAGQGQRPTEGGPRLPMERMYSSVIEVYDATSGKLLAEHPLNALATHFVADDRFLIYSVNADDLAQLEVWEMKLRR